MNVVDLNSDLGESFGPWVMGRDEDVLTFVSSANVACGFHGGDPAVMRRTVRMAAERGVAVGAHPSYPDKVGFGRREMNCTPDEIYADVLYQIGALRAFCGACGVPLQHVKPHGAMYNTAGRDEAKAAAIAQAVRDAGGGLILLGLAGSALERAAQTAGVRFAAEAFADRGYMDDGSLVPRSRPSEFVTDPDLAADLPKYRVWENGRLTAEPTDARPFWRDDLVAFLVGCSFSFETAMAQAGCPVRHIECGCNVPMYLTNQPCRPAGRMKGNMVVSMRPVPSHLVSRAVLSSGRFPRVHGAPVWVGNPEGLGVADLSKPDFGEPVPINPGEVPLFWGCGVTPQAALMASKPPFAITHAPGHMFICDVRDNELAVFP